MALPRPWTMVEQHDELSQLTERDIEERVQALQRQIPRVQERVRTLLHRVERDLDDRDNAEEIADTLLETGPDAAPDLLEEAAQVAQREEERTDADLRQELEATRQLAWLHEEMRYGRTLLSTCNYVRGLEREALQHLTEAIEKFAEAASQLALPHPRQEVELRLQRQRTVKLGEELATDTKELSIKLLTAPSRSDPQPNTVLQVVFKIAHFMWEVVSLAMKVAGAFTQVFWACGHVLKAFAPLLPASSRWPV